MKDYLKIIAFIAADQIIKALVRGNMNQGQSIPVIKGILNFTYVQNLGAAWNSFSGQSIILIVIPLVAIALGIYYFEKHRQSVHPTLYYALILIIAGGLGNQIDRIIFGYVTDVIDFQIWPVFNVADIGVCLGCALLLIYVLFFDKPKEKEVKD